jgi:hypothetical protein
VTRKNAVFWDVTPCGVCVFCVQYYADILRGSVVVKALCHKPEGRGFETDEVNDFVKLPNPSGRTRPWSLLSH